MATLTPIKHVIEKVVEQVPTAFITSSACHISSAYWVAITSSVCLSLTPYRGTPSKLFTKFLPSSVPADQIVDCVELTLNLIFYPPVISSQSAIFSQSRYVWTKRQLLLPQDSFTMKIMSHRQYRFLCVCS